MSSLELQGTLVERLRRAARLPAVVSGILELALEDAPAAEIARGCESDLALTARIVALANSRVLGARRPARSLLAAATALGTNRVRNFALVCWLSDIFQGLDAAFPLKRYWRHAFLVAATCRGLLADDLAVSGEDLYLAGLIHDAGAAFLCGSLPGEYVRALDLAREKRAPLRHVEQELFGIDHAGAIALAAESWALPDDVRAALDPGGSDAPSPDGIIGRALRRADAAAVRLGWGWQLEDAGGAARTGSDSADPADLAAPHASHAQEVCRLLALLSGPRGELRAR